MQRLPPTKRDIEQPALALLVLLYLIRRRTGTRTNDLFDQHPPIEQDVIDELGLKKQDLWFTLAAELMLQDYGEQHLEQPQPAGRSAGLFSPRSAPVCPPLTMTSRGVTGTPRSS